ncbi:hypothetical protein BDA96_03G448300 [Sorghum bicolor]|uniref:Knottin scorpion toxin-like domain-containing protein n=2 Tax=Sorghum bicolor TaxID=4558 RepID=A0A921RIP6_SORBI|nr:hypothetical protein BDA96_03G448300 [Sorghum bicolor]KXG34064.1 hypothetical protein SORBI_3003G415800 [Sorghum bicolor]
MAFSKDVVVPTIFIQALLLVVYCAEAKICTRPNPFYLSLCQSDKDCGDSCIHFGIGTSGFCKGRRPPTRVCTCNFECPRQGRSNLPGVKPLSSGQKLLSSGDEPPSSMPELELSN